MLIWSSFVEIVRIALFGTAHVFGGSVGAGIFVFSLVLRIALLPWTIRAARQMRAQREKLLALKPDLDRLRKRHGRDWRALNDATTALYAKHGVDAAPKGMLASLVQLPIGAAIYRSVSVVQRNTSFLWIRDLTNPDVALAALAAAIAAFAARANAGEQQRVAVIVSATITFFFAWRMSASVALYSIAWSGVNATEAFFVRRTTRT